MKYGDRGSLCELTDALYQRELAQLRELLDQETRLRAALAQLAEQARAAGAQPEAALAGLREIGGDMVWQAWLGRQRTALQAQLARLLSRKERVLPALRVAHGKQQAAIAMQRDAQAQACRRNRLRQSDALLGLAVLSEGLSRDDRGSGHTS